MSAKAAAQVDVIVVGGGGAGLAAAIEARMLGRSVMLLEKTPRLGGSTRWSVGSVSATSTPHQLKAGVKDSPQDHFEDLATLAGELAPRDNLALRRLLVEHAPETFRWLVALGVEFQGPMPEPPNRRPRMHNVIPHSGAFIHHLRRCASSLGVDIRLNARVNHLIRQDGRIIGVEIADGDDRAIVRGAAVVLATGDFGGSATLKAQFVSEEAAQVDAVNVTNTGDGHVMAMALGARVVNGDLIHGPEIRFVPPTRLPLVSRLPPYRFVSRAVRWMTENLPNRALRPFLMNFLTTTLAPSRALLTQSILVNKRGERIDPAKAGFEIAQQPDKCGYLILDSETAAKFDAWPHFISTAPGIAYAYFSDYRRSRADLFHTARSLEALAAMLGMNAGALITSTRDLKSAPFYALGPLKSYVIFTDGGLAVNERLEVLDEQDHVIPGLFAAGSAGQGGVLLEGHGHHLAWAFTSGRIAGQHAAFQAVTPVEIKAGSVNMRGGSARPIPSPHAQMEHVS
jgi:succinate dehydrogenase/fumarate reductase flavoprotein subunit